MKETFSGIEEILEEMDNSVKENVKSKEKNTFNKKSRKSGTL